MSDSDLPTVPVSCSAQQESYLAEKDPVPEEHPSQTSLEQSLVEAERLLHESRAHHGLTDESDPISLDTELA